ncbi:MAG: transcriptional regulator, HxlR family [Rhodopila sp.]|jgi:DNA-binding HxlR family transcriptional regulator|nr:transcriptional regulator, HxlR family [Rhodopila sp.]
MMQSTALRSFHIESYAMQHTRLDTLPCPIARALDRVGEWWNILILRDAFRGLTRFDQFQKSLGIAPNILSRRLRGLVEAGLLEKIRYNQRPPRDEYVLTPVGRDFQPVLWAMLAWGNRHFMPFGQEVALVDPATGLHADPVMVDGKSGKRLDQAVLRPIPRPTLDDARRRQS